MSDIQILIHPVIFLPERCIQKIKPILDLQHGIAIDGITTLTVKACRIHVDLNLAQHINMGLSGKFAAGSMMMSKAYLTRDLPHRILKTVDLTMIEAKGLI